MRRESIARPAGWSPVHRQRNDVALQGGRVLHFANELGPVSDGSARTVADRDGMVQSGMEAGWREGLEAMETLLNE